MSPETSKSMPEQPYVERLQFSPVPLEPLTATHPNTGESYTQTSTTHIAEGWQAALQHAKETGWIDPNDELLVAQIDAYVGESLQSTQNNRILYQASVHLDESVDRTDPRVMRALDARSTPQDNFGILMAYPTIGEIELAKQSHSLDFSATKDMDAAVLGVILDMCTSLLEYNPRYKLESRNNDIPAAIVVRKTPLARCETEHGDIVVTKRQALLVRGDPVARGYDDVLDRKIRNSERFDELTAKIEGYMQHIDEISEENRTWLQPTITSYYAAYERMNS